MLNAELALVFAFEFIGAAYCACLGYLTCYPVHADSKFTVHTGQGKLALAAHEFRIGGGFAFVTGLVSGMLIWWSSAGSFADVSAGSQSGIYIDISLLFAAVGFPIQLPIFDLSTWFLKPRERKDHIA